MQPHGVPMGGVTQARFQSSPGQKAGCNLQAGDGLVRAVDVSILTRPEGRMQPESSLASFSTVCLFQSSPGQKAGCNEVHDVVGDLFKEFQSSPGQKAGCN